MNRFFKRKGNRKSNTDDSDSSSSKKNSSSSSRVNEEIDIQSIKQPSAFTRPRLNDEEVQKHLASTWPRLPEVAITSSDNSPTNLYSPNIPNSPALSSSSHSNLEIIASRPNSYGRRIVYKDGELVSTDTNSESDTEVNENLGDIFDDEGSIKTLSQLPSLNNDHHKNEIQLDDPAAATLVEAALDKDEAKDRHVRFQEHVAESAALVQRMLSVKRGHHHNPDALGTAMQSRYDSRPEEEMELQPSQPALGGGSVLASLMKLEASRHDGEVKKAQAKQKKVTIFFFY